MAYVDLTIMLVVFTDEAVGTYGFDGFAPTQVLELPVSTIRLTRSGISHSRQRSRNALTGLRRAADENLSISIAVRQRMAS